jgi:cytochrome c6
VSRGRKSRRRREAVGGRAAADERHSAERASNRAAKSGSGEEGPPPDPERPSLPRRALALLGRYDLVILLLVGIAVAIYLGLPDDDEDASTAPALEQPGVTTGPEAPPEQAERDERDRDRASQPASPRETFSHDCGTCHTLQAAGTMGITGPDLDQVEPSKEQVLRFIRTGSLDGVMPPNLLRGEKAEQVAEFVARTAGGG